MAEFFEEAGDFLGNGTIPITKYKAKDTGLNVYFVDIESQVISGYFCYGVDQPESSGIETMLWQLDSSGGLLPRGLRSEIIRPTWQHHGVENALADRDQSSYVCCALGETAFLGTFPCCTYLLQNIEALFDMHGLEAERPKKHVKLVDGESSEPGNKPLKEGGEPGLEEDTEPIPGQDDGSDKDSDYECEISEPDLGCKDFYFLSEAGEGAMAWEATLQVMFPGVRAFWNRLLCDAKSRLSPKMRECYDNFYRPHNLTVILTGTLADRSQILEALHEYEEDYKVSHPDVAPFVPPWSEPIPAHKDGVISEVRFIPRNMSRDPIATICFGWRGCPSCDLETAMALKVFTAHAAVGPLWADFVTTGMVHRISWCQLEYVETCSLVTVHGIPSDENVEAVVNGTKKILTRLGDPNDDLLKVEEVRAMANRVGWHYVRELESDPFIVLAAGISKGERYGGNDPSQVQKRIHPRIVFEELAKKPLEYWKTLASTYFKANDTYATKVAPKTYSKEELALLFAGPEGFPPTPEIEEPVEEGFADSSRRASSRARSRKSDVQALNRSVADLAKDFQNINLPSGSNEEPKKEPEEAEDNGIGHLEELVKLDPFPFGDHPEEVLDFEVRLRQTSAFLDQVRESTPRCFPIKGYSSFGLEQHPQFPVNDMPFCTYLEDLETSFVYITFVLDTTHLNKMERKLIAPITAALGAILCPRPPGLDTDPEITNPTEFYPPQKISDSQVSLGLNGELMQCIFTTLIALPTNYDWTVRMFHFVLYEIKFVASFLQFVAEEAAKGLAHSFKSQSADIPNYNCFDSSEINLHSIIRNLYKEESNARLFVGRRRLDLINEYLADLKKDPEQMVAFTNATWRKIVDQGKINVQIGTNLQQLTTMYPEPVKSWQSAYSHVKKPTNYAECRPVLERDLMNKPVGEGISVAVTQNRAPCFTTAIPINASNDDYAKLCICAQLFSMAQKWVWTCLLEDDCPQPVLRMPCPYSNMLTLTLESPDLIGALEAMKRMIDTDWPWLSPLLVATKLMVVNDPAAVELGPQGAIALAILAHLSNHDVNYRRELVMKSLNVTVDDLKQVITDYLVKLFDPEQCWYALLSSAAEEESLTARLKESGFNLKKADLVDVCTGF